MALFPKDRRAAKSPAEDGGKVPGTDGAVVSHRVTKDLERSETLAGMLAHSRASRTVEVADLLAGMYIYEWENLAKFWDQQDEVEAFLQQICRISPQRWPKGLKAATGKAAKPNGAPLRRSAELQNILKTAEELSPARDFVDGRAIPILTCECVLLAIAKKTDSEIGHRLVATGLNVTSLEESARNPKHAPKH
jgi:hypothetical protein